MGSIRNMTEENVNQVDDFLNKLKVENPELKWKFFNHENESLDKNDLVQRIESLEQKIDSLKSFIENIFDSHVLIKGKFIDVTNINHIK